MGSRSSSASAELALLQHPRSLRAEDLVVVAAAGMLAVACIISPSASTTGPILCPFRLVTGLPCPGCGMTRAWVAAAHGDVVASALYNPYGLAFFGIAIFLVAWRVAFTLRPTRLRPVSLDWLTSNRFGWAFLASWVVFGMSRLSYLWATGL